ncbi:hypothetical protein LRP52_45380 [Photobacterium sp. ZSDE20]|uniref:Uncharacterized protein n=1 Tax=Photobacterium pectinilyticum TaxID=2906793 RepID=A0ABT1N8T2_9GAMM|nr:hypothetical protein [Photobacterium sp. ZSDE20]MCQ1061141.1 hypothetical protein [Photobacterium sp. ZSDE20]MDD1829394.1 hypothetical protein [Photobacterium sp. ZSDE20]
MKPILSISLIFLCLSPFAFSAEPSPAANAIVQNAKEECARFEGGEFHATEQAISHHDFTGDGQPEEIVDASQFSCSTSASMYGGSGGTFLWVVVDGKPYEFLANKWITIDFDGQSVLLLAVHSSECSDTIGPCYRALVWSDGFRTAR